MIRRIPFNVARSVRKCHFSLDLRNRRISSRDYARWALPMTTSEDASSGQTDGPFPNSIFGRLASSVYTIKSGFTPYSSQTKFRFYNSSLSPSSMRSGWTCQLCTRIWTTLIVRMLLLFTGPESCLNATIPIPCAYLHHPRGRLEIHQFWISGDSFFKVVLSHQQVPWQE